MLRSESHDGMMKMWVKEVLGIWQGRFYSAVKDEM